MTLNWKIEFDCCAVEELRKLDHQIQRDILGFFRERIATERDPRRFGKSLSKDFAGLWRYRIRHYRMICNIEDSKLVVLVIRAGQLKETYQ